MNYRKFANYKTCICITKTVKTYRQQVSKKILLISKNKIKGKSNCAFCLPEKTFIHEIEGKYGLESESEIYL